MDDQEGEGGGSVHVVRDGPHPTTPAELEAETVGVPRGWERTATRSRSFQSGRGGLSPRQGLVKEKRGVVKTGERGQKGIRTYGQRFRSIRHYGSERGWRAESWSLEGNATDFDAEVAALVRELEICVMDAVPGAVFNIFVDSQAAMKRVETDEPDPGQERATRGIRLAMEIVKRGASVSVGWIPGHAGVQVNEMADTWALEAAKREERSRAGIGEGGRKTGEGDLFDECRP